jgi:hypothetical protein
MREKTEQREREMVKTGSPNNPQTWICEPRSWFGNAKEEREFGQKK